MVNILDTAPFRRRILLYGATMQRLKEQAYEATLFLPEHKLVVLTWGNVSAFDAKRGLMAIKPSGVRYADLTPAMMVVLDCNGRVVDGDLRPSSDTPTHLALYRAFPELGGIAHTHSRWATIWSQMCRPIPRMGTTHADTFATDIPCTRVLGEDETKNGYEANTGKALAEAMTGLSPLHTPAALVAGHGPFTWGKTALAAAEHALILEEVAAMAWHTAVLNPDSRLPAHIGLVHFLRKHGPNASYGQG